MKDQGQGGAQAIEDGAALGMIFTSDIAKADIPELLRGFQGVRHDHAAAIQCLSNVSYDESGSAGKVIEKFVEGPVPSTWFSPFLNVFVGIDVLTLASTETFEETQQFIYGHDFVLEAEAGLARYERERVKK